MSNTPNDYSDYTLKIQGDPEIVSGVIDDRCDEIASRYPGINVEFDEIPDSGQDLNVVTVMGDDDSIREEIWAIASTILTQGI